MRSWHGYTCTNQKDSSAQQQCAQWFPSPDNNSLHRHIGCKWPWRQLLWACLTTHLMHSQGLGSSLFPKTKQQPHLSLHLRVCFLCSREAWPQGGPGAALCRRHNHIPQEIHHQLQPRWGVDTLKSWLCMTKARQPQTQQGHKLIYLAPYLQWKDNLAVLYLTAVWFQQLIALVMWRAAQVPCSSSPLAHTGHAAKFTMMTTSSPVHSCSAPASELMTSI